MFYHRAPHEQVWCLVQGLSHVLLFMTFSGTPFGNSQGVTPNPRDGKPSVSLEDTMMFQILTEIKGKPEALTEEEMRMTRHYVPLATREYVRLMNNPRLQDELAQKKISQDVYDDLERSLVSLEVASCSLSQFESAKPCLVIRDPIDFPIDPIIYARLSTFVLPWISPNELSLTVHRFNPLGDPFPSENIYKLDNVTRNKIPSRIESPSQGREVTWDVTTTVMDLQSEGQTRNKDQIYPVALTLNCIQLNQCHRRPDTWRLFTHPQYRDAILNPEGQAVLEMYTDPTLRLIRRYTTGRLQRRSIGMSQPRQECPSFLSEYRRETKCCLFRFTLNKRQLDRNDQLRFIVFPHYLPINVCHGRCIGLYMPTDNTHSFLLNRYFSGLNSAEREILYDSMPCCAANETKPFTIAYMTKRNKLRTEKLLHAVKTNCACN